VSFAIGGSNANGDGATSLQTSRYEDNFTSLASHTQIFKWYAGITLFASQSNTNNNYAAVNYIVGDSAFNSNQAGCSMFLGANVYTASVYITKSGSAVFGMPISRPAVSYNPSLFGDVPASQLYRLPSRAIFIGDARAGHNQPPAMEFSSNGGRSDFTAVLSMSGSDQFGCWTTPSNSGTTSFGFLTGWKVNTSNGRMAIGRTTGVTGTTNGYSNTTTHVLTVAGGVAGTIAYATLSDRRDKEDITPIESGLDIVNRLNPVTYLSKYAEEGKRTPGYIAQDVLEVAPDVVHGNEDGYMMSYESLTPYYAKAIQELDIKVEAQRLTIEALLARIEALENK
jgi:hypothetical protein